jgi:hypothetical protein
VRPAAAWSCSPLSNRSPSSTTAACAGAITRMKSKLYLSGVKNTYEDRNCSIGGTIKKLGSPPGSPRGTPAASWLAETLPSMIGASLSSRKSLLLTMVANEPSSPSTISDSAPASDVRIRAPAAVAAITRKYSGCSTLPTMAPARTTASLRLAETVATKRFPAVRIGSSCSSR